MLNARASASIGMCLLISLCPAIWLQAAEPRDPRNFSNGSLIPDEDYSDQPRIVVTKDGTWVCLLTTANGEEGAGGQHMVSTTSKDKGKTWTPLVDVEPPDNSRKSSYGLALITPADRVYAFYCYNGDAITKMPDGTHIRDDMQGWLVYRYSDDQGKSWSERHRIDIRRTAADRGNQWQGKLQMWWAIGTPAVFDGKMIFGFTKLGRYILEEGEGWFCRSDNVLTEKDPAKIQWQILPDGDHGVRHPDFGTVQEEFDVVHLSAEELMVVFRTALGHAGSSYSRDGGHTWSKPDALRYSPGGKPVKQPRACPKIWKTKNGRYLLWFHNNSTTTYNNGPNAGSRNIAWLTAGRLKDGFVHWSQPEIVAYVEGGLEGCSYPDLIEDGGKTYICATQKTEARVFEVQDRLLNTLWNQDGTGTVATNGLVLSLTGDECNEGAIVKAPRLPQLGGEVQGRVIRSKLGGGLAVEASMNLANLAPGQALVDTRDKGGRGWVLQTAEDGAVRLDINDGWQATFWQSDAKLLTPNQPHHITAIVDGSANAIWFLVDGVFCDGGAPRQFGFGRFGYNFKTINGDRLKVGSGVQTVRVYNRAILTSEAVGNFRASKAN